MNSKPLVAPAGAPGAIGTVPTFFSILAGTSCLSEANFIPSVVKDAGCLIVERMHLMKYLVTSFNMAAATNVKVLA